VIIMRTMKKKTQRILAQKAMISEPFLSLIVNGERRPSWKVAKRLAAVTKTKPELWLEGEPEHMQRIARPNRNK
jgi:transcriptional regulator with XRE-family HTH domain